VAGRQRLLAHSQTLGFGKCLQGFFGVLAQLAVDLTGREAGAGEQHLRLDDCGIDLVVGRQLALEFRVVDRRRIEAREGWRGETDQQHQPGKQAAHREISKKLSDKDLDGPEFLEVDRPAAQSGRIISNMFSGLISK
jgi:hypothetical protein